MSKKKAMNKKLTLFNSLKRLLKNNRKMIFAFIGRLIFLIIEKLIDILF